MYKRQFFFLRNPWRNRMRASILLLLASTAWAEPPYFEDYYSYSRSRGRALHKVEKSKAPACEKHFSKRAQLALSDANREPPAKFTECVAQQCKGKSGKRKWGCIDSVLHDLGWTYYIPADVSAEPTCVGLLEKATELQVVLMAGQSNMAGYGVIPGAKQQGTLANVMKQRNFRKFASWQSAGPDGVEWASRCDVFVSFNGRAASSRRRSFGAGPRDLPGCGLSRGGARGGGGGIAWRVLPAAPRGRGGRLARRVRDVGWALRGAR